MYKFEKLALWNRLLIFIKNIYSFCKQLPRSEEHNLISQLKRASTSIALNLAEGTGADSDEEFKRYLLIARKSLFETMAILKIIEQLYGHSSPPLFEEINEIGKSLGALIKYLKKPTIKIVKKSKV